jgi:hypothetical protein
MAHIALRAALGWMGFSAAASTYIVDNQGMDTLDEFKVLNDLEVEDLCKVVCRPGGTIPIPNAASVQPPQITNPGIYVLKIMWYFLRFKERTTRPVTLTDITLDNICSNRDGRAAFLGLKEHYLGASNVDSMASKAASKLNQSVYQRENRRWTFEKYVRLHVDQHAILEGLKDQNYSGFDERIKVSFLLAGIKLRN